MQRQQDVQVVSISQILIYLQRTLFCLSSVIEGISEFVLDFFFFAMLISTL